MHRLLLAATSSLAALLLLPPGTLAAEWDGTVVCNPTFPGNNTDCACAPAHPGCSLSQCVDRCTCLGGGCAMPVCLTNCICPDGGCTLDACVSGCDAGDIFLSFDDDQEDAGPSPVDVACDVGAACDEEGSKCTKGSETCCGESYHSFECECVRGSDGGLGYMCMYTDACMRPWCERPTDAPTTTSPQADVPTPTKAPTTGDSEPTPLADTEAPVTNNPPVGGPPIDASPTPATKPDDGNPAHHPTPWVVLRVASCIVLAAMLV